MKNTDTIQLTILVIALLLGYNALQTFPYLLWLLYNWLADGLTLTDRFFTLGLNFLYLAFYIIGGIFLIKKSKDISLKISDAASFSSDTKIVLKKNDVLYVTLIVMGCYILTTRLPKLLVKIYAYIRESNNPLSYDGPNFILPGESIPEFIIVVILATVMLVYAKTITEYFTGYDKEDTDIDTIGSKLEEN
jgi:hypothetical protein